VGTEAVRPAPICPRHDVHISMTAPGAIFLN
jgi:hypothetical protein